MQKYFNYFLDEQGNRITSASVLVKTNAGGAATIYSDNSGTITANPLTTDGSGYFEFYAPNGTYTLELSKTGYTTATIPSVLLDDPAVASIAALRAAGVPTTDNATITVLGDGGGQFYWNASSTDADDGIMTILPTGYAGAGRWKRISIGLSTILASVGLSSDMQAFLQSANDAAALAELGATTVVETVADLRALTDYTNKTEVLGGEFVGDGLEGVYVFDATSTASDNHRTVIRPTAIAKASPGRWELVEVERESGVEAEQLTKVIDTATYDAFGVLLKTGADTLTYFTRQGTDHVGSKGDIVKATYTLSTKTWSVFSSAYSDATYDARNVGGGVVGNRIILFFGRYNQGTSTWVDVGYITSTDGGATWSAYTTINITALGLTAFSPHGHIVELTDGTLLQPFYGDTGTGTYKLALFESSDDGATWTLGDTIYSGATAYTELAIEHIGDDRLVAFIRQGSGSGVGAYQATSSDGGATWSAPAITNLGRGLIVPWLGRDGNRLIAIYADRYDDMLRTAYGDADEIFTDPMAYKINGTLLNGSSFASGLLGYASFVKLGPNRYYAVAGDNLNPSTDADTYGGEFSIDENQARNGAVLNTHNTGAQNIAPGAATTIIFDSLDSDDEAAYNKATGVWAPKRKGYYRLSVALVCEGVLTTDRYAILSVYRVGVGEYARLGGSFLLAGSACHVSGSSLIYSDGSMTFDIRLLHNNAANVTLNPYDYCNRVTAEFVG